MIEKTNPEIDVEQLMARIREEVARRKQLMNQSMSLPVPATTDFDWGGALAGLERAWTPIPEYRLQPAFTPNPERRYTLNELLRFHDHAFVTNAYLAILQRPADDTGLQHFLKLLRQGESKITILGRLRYSAEGRQKGVKIRGLAGSFLLDNLYRIPLLGRLLRTLAVLAHLSGLERNQRCFEAYAMQHLELLNSQVAANNKMLQNGLIPLRTLLAASKDNTDIAALQELVNTSSQQHQEQITQLQEYLKTDLNTQLRLLDERKADTTIVQDLVTTFYQQHYQEEIVQLQEYLRNDVTAKLHLLEERKVDTAQLTRLTNHFTEIAHAKADHAALAEVRDSLSQAVQARADQAALAEVRDSLSQTIQAKADQAALAEVRDSLSQTIQAKAEQATLAEVRDSLSQAVQAKADQAALAEVRDSLSQVIQDKADRVNVDKIGIKVREQQQRLYDQKRSLLDQHRRLGLLLEEARKRLPASLDNTQLATFANEADHLLSAMYATFEDRFRGDRAEIKQRMSVYLPIIEAVQIGTLDAPIVDIGCGRGEWLELLKERNLTARGVDINRVMVNECRERGFEVVEADVLHYLRQLPDNSLGTVTGMHIIEHLPLPILIALLDESLRVLQPGGLVIFETPNPENLVVGACNFYIDPTHRNPLPPAMMEYLVEARGFVRVEIQRWQQNLQDPLQFLPANSPGAAEINPLIQIIKNHYFVAPDYAVIGHKV